MICVDDDAEVLRAVERDLRRRYAEKFRVLRAGSRQTALAILKEFHIQTRRYMLSNSLARTSRRRHDTNMNRNITVFLLLINLFAAGSVAGQTRRGTTNRRAPRRTTRSRPSVRPPVAAPPSSAAVTTASGLTYIVTRRGAGRPLKTGDRVTVNYTGLLTNGAKFDSSLDRGTPFTFQLGAGRVIKGWDEGVARLRVGDHATFILPPQLAYGARGAGSDIPPDSTLVFIIEVLRVEDAPMPSAPLND